METLTLLYKGPAKELIMGDQVVRPGDQVTMSMQMFRILARHPLGKGIHIFDFVDLEESERPEPLVVETPPTPPVDEATKVISAEEAGAIVKPKAATDKAKVTTTEQVVVEKKEN